MWEYHTEFEKLANHTKGLPEAFYLSYFISGLKDAICSEVKIFCPRTMMEALGLDKLVEDNIWAQQCPKSNLVSFRPMVPKRTQNSPAPRTTPIKHLSEAEMQNFGKKGFVIIMMRNSPRDIDVLRKISITWMWIFLPAPKIFEDAQDTIDYEADI